MVTAICQVIISGILEEVQAELKRVREDVRTFRTSFKKIQDSILVRMDKNENNIPSAVLTDEVA